MKMDLKYFYFHPLIRRIMVNYLLNKSLLAMYPFPNLLIFKMFFFYTVLFGLLMCYFPMAFPDYFFFNAETSMETIANLSKSG